MTGPAWPGGAQPGGGSKALLGSTGRAGAAVTTTAAGAGADVVSGGVEIGAGGGAGGVGAVATDSVGGGMGVAVTGAGCGAAATAGSAAATTGDAGGLAAAASASAALRAASTRSLSARALRSVSRAAFAISSCCAFCPPLAPTTEPICVVPRVSSTATMPESYWRPAPADGRLADTATERSAPARTCWLLTGLLPSNQSQPASSAAAETPSSRLARRPPIMSRYPPIFTISPIVSLVSGRPRS